MFNIFGKFNFDDNWHTFVRFSIYEDNYKQKLINCVKNKLYDCLNNDVEYLQHLIHVLNAYVLGVSLKSNPNLKELETESLEGIFYAWSLPILCSSHFITKTLIDCRVDADKDFNTFLSNVSQCWHYEKDCDVFFRKLWEFVDVYFVKECDLWFDWFNTQSKEFYDMEKGCDYEDNYELYVVLFDNGIIKVGKGINALCRIQEHSRNSLKFGSGVVKYFVEKTPKITEQELIDYCGLHGSLCGGKEYFKELNYEDVVNFVRNKKIKRKEVKL